MNILNDGGKHRFSVDPQIAIKENYLEQGRYSQYYSKQIQHTTQFV